MATDVELLRRYVEEKTEGAFAELVRRYLNLVYATALRRTGGRHVLAEEIAQKVFTSLARKAAQLTGHPTLAGWLYRSTRNIAIDIIRNEQRRDKLTRTLTTMTDESSPAESAASLEELKPLIDEALDQLKESDREIVLLRFFQGLTFVEVGAKLNLTENNSRMRTERALEKLRVHLGRRGITSTTALVGLLTSESLVAAPASLATNVTSTAVASASAGALTPFFTQLLMNKIAVTSLSAALAVALTSLAWAATNNVSDRQLAALRAENERLTKAAAAAPNSEAVTAVVDEFAANASAIIQAVDKRVKQKNTAALVHYSNHGQATPRDALLTYAWALETGDSVALGRTLTYDEGGKASIDALFAGLPESVRAQYHTPEEFVIFVFIAHTLLRPLPGPDVTDRFVMTETGPGRANIRAPGATQGGMDLIQTPEGWKCVVTAEMPPEFAKRVLGSEMLAGLGHD